MRALLTAAALVLLPLRMWAADVRAFSEGEQLGVTVTELNYPASFEKDLTSGLTNRLLIRIDIRSGGATVAQRSVDVAIKYDLWDERFQLNMSMNGVQVEAHEYASVQDVMAFLKPLKLKRLFAVQGLPDQMCVVRMEVFINPMERERLAKVRRWVIDNSMRMPSDLTGSSGTGESSGSRPNALLNKIFEQYASGADVAAAWAESVTSEPFRPREVR